MTTKINLTTCLVFILFHFSQAQRNGINNTSPNICSESDRSINLDILASLPVFIKGVILNTSCSIDDKIILSAIEKSNNTLPNSYSLSTKDYTYLANRKPNRNGDDELHTFSKDIHPAQSAIQKPVFQTNFIPDSELNPYYDAKELVNGTPEDRGRILKKYKWTGANPFFSGLEIDTSSSLESFESESTANFAASSSKGINVTKFADGFAKFIAAQFKKELTISFFNRFRDKLNNPNLRDLRVLFKNTSAELNLIGDNFVQYQAYLSSLRQNMQYDCHQLPDQFNTIIQDPNSQIDSILSLKPNLQYIVQKGASFAIDLRDSVHIGRALADLDLSGNAGVDPVLSGALQTIQLLSESLRDEFKTPDKPYWIQEDQLKELVSDSLLFKSFIGLVAQMAKNKGIHIGNNSLFDLLAKAELVKAQEFVESVVTSIQKIQRVYLSSRNSTNLDNKDILAMNYFDSASDLINSSNHLQGIVDKEEFQKIKLFDGISNNITNMVKAFTTEKYSIGLLQLTALLTSIDSEDKTIKKINAILGNQGLFIAQMAESKTSDEVATILENYAAPTGSWRDKRTAQWNISIDSYVGPAYYKPTGFDYRFAFSTPVGASVTIPVNQLTFFISIFDIGPLTSFRLGNDTSEVANVYLKEIIAPGAFVSFSFGKNFPITLNAGYQEFPLLEKVALTENSVLVRRQGGFSGSFVMNIPLFTLFNRRKE